MQSEHVARNRAVWDDWSERYAGPGERAWRSDAITWGIWQIPETKLQVLPDVRGKDVLEVGCGTAYFSCWLARRGAAEPHQLSLDSRS